MHVSYELTFEDLAAFARMHQARSPAVRRQRFGCVTVAFVAMLGLPLLILLTSDEPLLVTARNIWPLLLGPVLLAIFGIPYIKWRTGQMTRTLLAEGDNTGFYGPCTLFVEEHGLRESKASGESARNWSAVKKIIATATHLFVFTSAVDVFIVPRRAFGSDAEFDQFVGRIASHSQVVPEC